MLSRANWEPTPPPPTGVTGGVLSGGSAASGGGSGCIGGPLSEPYADKAGEAAVAAAKAGDLELRHVDFAYPVRAEMPGARVRARLCG